MKLLLTLTIVFISYTALAQGAIEAEIDTSYFYQFKSLKETNNKKILVDRGHNSIYSNESGVITAREMFRIIKEDGYKLSFTDKKFTPKTLTPEKTDLLVLHGMPNNKIKLNTDSGIETLYLSPLTNEEVETIGKFVFNGGGLLLFLSHFPGGSGALPLLEALGVKFRDGYAYQHQYHTSKGGKCRTIIKYLKMAD